VARRGIVWGAGDLTGGPVDEIFAALRARFTDLWIERVWVVHPTDSDTLWYLGRHGSDEDIQVECLPEGRPPFLLESDTAREEVLDVRDAVATLGEWLEAM
jgi:hypothetical protein